MLWNGFDASEVVIAQIEFDVLARCNKNRRIGDGGNWVERHHTKSPGMSDVHTLIHPSGFYSPWYTSITVLETNPVLKKLEIRVDVRGGTTLHAL